MKRFILVATTAIVLAGCANTSTLSGDVYTSDQAKRTQMISYGTIVSARPVQIQANSSTSGIVGTLGGAVLGGLIGNTIGGGTGQRLATAGGAIGGAVAGQAIENSVSRVDAVELEIKQEGGSTIVVVQKGSINQFHTGQAVRLVSYGKTINVSPR